MNREVVQNLVVSVISNATLLKDVQILQDVDHRLQPHLVLTKLGVEELEEREQ